MHGHRNLLIPVAALTLSLASSALPSPARAQGPAAQTAAAEGAAPQGAAPQNGAEQRDAAAQRRPEQRSFASAEAAAAALIDAARRNHDTQLLGILGADGMKLIRSGDPIADALGRARLAAAFDQGHHFERTGADKLTLVVGEHAWPVPIPLVREHGRWRFDTRAGAQEVLNRRIGRNEIEAIAICRAYVEAQREYAALKIGGRAHYAQRFLSTSGQRDGLYWPVRSGEPPSPLGPLVAQAQAAGYPVAARGKPVPTASTPAGKQVVATAIAAHPYHGYYFRILTAQGPHAAGGSRSYLIDGQMTDGFALLAYPASYGDSGIMTFTVNQNGIVFEKNLGARTARRAAQISRYDPDPSWRAP